MVRGGNIMNSKLYRIICALAVALSVSKLVLDVLGIAPDVYLMAAAMLVCAFLLSQHTPAELALIGMLTLFVQFNAGVVENSSFNPDWLLSILISVILLPTAFHLMGMESRFRRVT
jgi:hypothetical protein